jgi:hypothetical protein
MQSQKVKGYKSSVNLMNEQEITDFTREQEEEIVNILIGSSLNPGMSQTNRQKLLQYLVVSYFNPLSGEDRRALPEAMQIVPATSIETH